MKSKTKYNYQFIPIFISGMNSYNKDNIIINTKNTFLVHINNIKKAERTNRNKITLKKYFISISKHINEDITLKQFRELNKIIYLMNYYNISISNSTIIKLLNNKIDNRFLDRLRLSACLKSQDSKLYFIILLGYNKGIEYWKIHKSDKIKGELNPGYNHNGRLSSLSKNFLKYENMNDNDIKESINNISLSISKTRKLVLNSSNQINYWLKRGYSQEQAKIEISKRQATTSKENYIKRYGKIVGLIRWIKRQRNWQKTLQSKSYEELKHINIRKLSGFKWFKDYMNFSEEEAINYISNIDKEDFKQYSNKIFKLSDIEYKKHKEILDPYNLRGWNNEDKYELDHKFSRFMGYVLKVPVEIMSSIYNLEILKLSDNKVKGLKCSITKEELYKLYEGKDK